jgi:hypothetical protein
MEPLNLGASLPDIQDYVRRMEAERGLDHQDLSSQCLKLGEEVGELYRAVRKLQGSPQDPAAGPPMSPTKPAISQGAVPSGLCPQHAGLAPRASA